jgi:hypothetical protein
MNIDQGEMYRKCASKLEKILSEQDCDLRIVVGHSNMLQSLMPAFILQYDNDNDNDDELEAPRGSNSNYEAESNLMAFSEQVKDLFPLLNEVSVTQMEMELPSDEDNGTRQVQQFVREKSHVVMRSALPVELKLTGPFVE